MSAQIQAHMKTISQAFINAGLSSLCLYGSVLLKEQLKFEGIETQLVAGYLQTNRGRGEVYRHVWLEYQKQIYDVSLEVLQEVSWKSCPHPVLYMYHYQPPALLPRTEPSLVDKESFEYGIQLYNLNPFRFWSEFDNSKSPIHQQIAPIINKLRDLFVN